MDKGGGFFWQEVVLKENITWLDGRKSANQWKKGGLGIKDLRKMNVNLICKRWWILEDEKGLWQDVVRLKYVKTTPTYLIPNRFNDSPVWKELMQVRHIYLMDREIKINNGKNVSF